VLHDLDHKVFFRWFDPRVLIYLNHIIDDERLTSILNAFEYWTFFHASGRYDIALKDKQQIKINRLLINETESIDLDLIELSNLAYQQAFKLDNIESDQIEPTHILKAMHEAYHQYQITNNVDLIAYALYSIVIHPNFMSHASIIKVLEEKGTQFQEATHFMTAMNRIAEKQWIMIRNELLYKEGYLNE